MVKTLTNTGIHSKLYMFSKLKVIDIRVQSSIVHEVIFPK